MAGEAMDICLWVLKESNKSRFDSYSVRNRVLNISHIASRDCRAHIFPTTFLEIAIFENIFEWRYNWKNYLRHYLSPLEERYMRCSCDQNQKFEPPYEAPWQ